MSKVCYICGYKTENNIEQCPQCGVKNQWVNNEAEYELSCISSDESFIQAMMELKEKDPIEYQLKLNQFKIQKEQQKKATEQKNNIVKCPKCGCIDIGVTNRGYSLVWGFIGSGKSMNVCKKCGYKWKP